MKSHTQGFENEIKTMGRQQNVLISYNDITLDSENINSVTFTYEGNILKSIMKGLIIDSNELIEEGQEINYKYGILVNGNYEYLDYGNFVVYEVQKKEDTDSYELKCYDKMLYAMQEYEPINITYPNLILSYLMAICNRLGYTLEYENLTNIYKQIPSDLYVGIGYTYRDVLDDIAEVLGCTIYIKDTGTPRLICGLPNEVGVTLDEEWFKDINVKFGEKFGPVNAIVLSRSAESDNVYIRDEESILANGLTEIKIVDNQIMNFNNRSEYLQGLADSLFGLEYYLCDFSSTGIMFLDFYDFYNVSIGSNTYKCLMLNDEQNVTQGLEENIYAERPEASETDYTKADKTDQRINQTYLIVDKQNQTIESVVSDVGDQNQKLSTMQQTINEINAKISDIADVTTSDSTSNGVLLMDNINESEPIKIEVHPLGMNISELICSEATIIGENTIIKSRTLRFTNLDTSEVWNYIIPDDLFYYDSEHYDTFTLEYEGQICQVEKKCKLQNGQVVLLQTPVITNYEYPSIELTTGNYRIELVGYSGYIFARLMCTNIYTEQFVTNVKLESELSQTAQDITASVNTTLEDYVTTSDLTSALSITSSNISSSVSETYATKTSLSEVDGKVEDVQKVADNAKTDAESANSALTGIGESIGDINTAISDIQEVSKEYTTKTELDQTKDSFEASITETEKTLTKSINGTQEEIKEMKNYIHYDVQDDTGTLTLGKLDNPYTLQLTNHELKINENDNTVAYFDEDSMQVTNGVFNTSLAIGNFEFRPETNGSLSFARRIGNGE